MARSRKRTKVLPFWLSIILVIVVVLGYLYLKKNGYFNNLVNSGGNIETPKAFEDMAEGGNGVLNLYFVDVGQGDCMIIELPDGKNMIIDSGDNGKHDKIKEFTDFLNISVFDYMILTHADADHVGNMDYVFDNYQVNKVFRPYVLSTHDNASSLQSGLNQGFSNSSGGNVKSSKSYYDFLLGLQNEPNCQSEYFNKDSDFFGSYVDENNVEHTYTFDFLTPTMPVNEIKYSDANDYSPIILLTYNDVEILLTGDAETEMENEFLDYYINNYPDCDVIKIGHHGSETSSQQKFLSAVKPEYAIIQCGVNKTYKHPRQATLDRLSSMNTGVYRNDKNGDIAISITIEEGYEFSSEYIYCDNTDVSQNFVGCDTYFESLGE